MNDLTIVYCKECKNFEKRKLEGGAILYGCRKDCGSFHPEEAQLLKDRRCFSKRLLTSMAKK